MTGRYEGIHGSAGWGCYIAVPEVTARYGGVLISRGGRGVWCVMRGVIVPEDTG